MEFGKDRRARVREMLQNETPRGIRPLEEAKASVLFSKDIKEEDASKYSDVLEKASKELGEAAADLLMRLINSRESLTFETLDSISVQPLAEITAFLKDKEEFSDVVEAVNKFVTRERADIEEETKQYESAMVESVFGKKSR